MASTVEKAKRKLSSNSTGNKHKFNQQLPKKSKDSLSPKLTASENFADIKIINQLDSLSKCCPNGGEWGCCLRHFIDESIQLPDYTKALQYVKDNRIISKEGATNEIRDPLIISIFKNSIMNDTFRGEERIFEMDYRIPSTSHRFGRDNSVKCCRKALLMVYGISEHEWKKTSAIFKECPIGENVTTLHHKP